MMLKKLFLLLFILLISFIINAQINLVPNGDFEAYTICPNGISLIAYATPWQNSGMLYTPKPCFGVFGIGPTTSDYLHQCANIAYPNIGVPNNEFGYQIDHNNGTLIGNGYAGIISYSNKQSLGCYDNLWREYISVHTNAMTLGNKYRLEYYTSLADSSRIATRMGMVLSDALLTSSTTTLHPTSSSIFYNSTSAVTDINNWTQISYDFTCYNTTLRYLTIGNFSDTTPLQYTLVKPFLISSTTLVISTNAYYYIDDVSLICIDSMPRNNLAPYYSLCNQTFPTLDAGGGSLGIIQWYKNGIIISGATSRYYTPTSLGTYSFTVTSTTIPGMTYSDTTIIYDSPLNTQISLVPNTDCDTFLNIYILNPQSNLIYNWTATNIASTYPTNLIGTSFYTKFDHTATSHIITLHVTDTKSSCIFDTSFIVYPCCRNDKTQFIYINQRINDLIAYNSIFSGDYFGRVDCQFCNEIFIDGTLTIDHNFRFKNTTFYMQTNSSIDIVSGDTLFLDSCYLTACSNRMWKGIINGSIEWGNGTLITKNCIIEDAENGITIINGSYTNCNSDTFNKNKIAIYIKPFNGTYSPLSVIKSSFICKDLGLRALLGFPDPGDFLGLLIYPYWALKTHECIVAENVKNIQIGAGCLNCTNYFENAFNGIHASSSNLVAYNNNFTSLQPYSTYAGAGILIDKLKSSTAISRYTATIGGYVVNLNNTFKNSKFGIISRNMASNILNNSFDFCTTGILVDSGYTPIDLLTPLNVQVKDNTISNYNRGIEGSFNNRTIIQIVRNNLETTIPDFFHPASIGILANQTIYNARYEIIDNTIKNGRNAISLLNVQRSLVIGNQIKMTSTNSFSIIGINCNNSSRNTIANNLIVGSSTLGATTSTTANSKAMYFAMSPKDTIYCNTTDTMTWGIEFMGDCISPNNIFGNRMNKHNDQMTLRSAGVIGPQTSRNFGLLTNRLMANEYSPTLYTRSNTCAFNSFGALNLFQTKSITPYRPLVNIAIGVATAINPSIRTNSNYLCSPYFSNGSGGTGLGIDSSDANEEKVMAEAIINGDIISDIENEAYQLWLKSELYYSLQQDSTQLADSSSTIQNFAINTASENIGLFYDIEQKIINEEVNDAIIINDATAPTIHLETNLKEIYSILLQLENTGYTQEIINTLISLANECPISGGKAVFISRALLNSIDLDAYWDDDDRCVSGVDYRRTNNASTNSIEKKEIVIYPNPAKNILFIAMDNVNETIAYIIRDITGKTEIKNDVNIDSGPISVDISNLSEGIYVIEIINSTNTNKPYKFNVIR